MLAYVLLKEVAITPTIVWPQGRNYREGTQPHPSAENWIKDLLSMALPIRAGLPTGASGKEATCQCRRSKRQGFNPWVRKIPWKRTQQPTPVFLPGESHGQRSLAGYSS